MVTQIPIDWETIEVEYRAGQLSIREIARQHNISDPAILKHAKTRGWTRDLTEQVKQRVKAKMVSEGVSISRANLSIIPDDDIIEQAADRIIKVVTLHRKDVAQQRSIADTLMKELQDNPIKKVFTGKGKDRQQVEVPLTINDRSSILRNIAQAAAKYIPLERQAHGADERHPTGSESDPIHIKHGMDTSGLQKAVGVPKPCVLPQLGEGKQKI